MPWSAALAAGRDSELSGVGGGRRREQAGVGDGPPPGGRMM